ncbi:hypothetical protein EV421DRAFT_1981235 [Armillaria borealis]|uniref:Aminoglycoside phosphotransferase domain-containing protein n=1 Tax=Armillaria borealis TaxID=47425 RepID=A0AA39MJQ3_9AGAR|nr:hypothetical protein EV421DRAFT_1981235 [Armillaria borealis]
MDFVRRHTTIPVPRAFGIFRYHNQDFLIMMRIPGKSLGFSEWKDLKDETKSALVAQLRDYVLQLGPAYDLRLCSDGFYRPYVDEEQMNLQLRLGVRLECSRPEVIESHRRPHPALFTHGDIAPRNIMVYGDRVTGILVWESAGWYLAHRKYLKALFGSTIFEPEGNN